MSEGNEQNINKQEQKEQEEQDSTKKALKTGAKAAANAYAGPIGGKAVDLASKTKVGNAALNAGANILNKAPAAGKIANIANKSGALDAADKGLDVANGNLGKDTALPTNNKNQDLTPKTKESNSSGSRFGKRIKNFFGNSDNEGEAQDSSSENESFASKIFQFIFAHKRIFISIFGGLLLLLVIIVTVIAITGSVVGGVIDFFNGVKDTFMGFFNKDQEQLMNNYYDTLKDVQTEFNQKYGICIDVNLITAALTVDTSVDDFVNDIEIPDPAGDGQSEISADGTTSQIPYKKMAKQVRLLANMQIMTNIYGLDKIYKDTNGNYCSNESSSILVDSTKINNYDGKTVGTGEIDCSNYELIASHDVSDFKKFFTKKSDEERNYAYYLYYPHFDTDGTCTDSYAKESLPEEKKELSIGNLATKEQSVFYWNLVNSFIPEYYAEYLPAVDSPDYSEKIKKIAEDIYLLYNDIGPSQTCTTSYQGPSSLCPNGITIDGVGTIDFEEYVAGVVSGESYSSEGIEALKAQAVAARTYALNLTNYCSSSIASSTGAQVFTKDINDKSKQAANSTAGEILVDSNGKIFSSQYDSFCYDDSDCPDSKRNQDGTYTVTYTKLPGGEKHIITLSDPGQYGKILNGQGHARGMSQLLSYQMAKEGKNYKEILSYFYSDGVEIASVQAAGGSAIGVSKGSVSEKLNYLFPGGLPSSNAEASRYMVTVEVPTVDIAGNKTTRRVTLHKAVAQDFINIMTNIANSGVPIKDVGCYNWRNAAASSSRSHHSYGVACDLNANENYMIKNGSVVSGSYYRPGTDPYSFPANGVVVKTFANYGWTWGGTWSSSKDYMHFSFTGY